MKHHLAPGASEKFYIHIFLKRFFYLPFQLSKDMWTELKNGIPIDEDLRHIANDLRRSTSITVLDTSAFTFAEMGDKKTALEIYEYRIFPMLQEQDDASISKYERHYAILQNCVPQSCMKELYNIN